MSSIPPTQARGYLGEQSMGFFLGERGYFFVDGPSGAGGHGITEKGFDGIAFNPKTRHLVIYDNKSFASTGKVSSASAIDLGRNLKQNLSDLIDHVETMTDMPNQTEILKLLRQTESAAGTRGVLPANVDFAVSNASGRSSGVGARLSGQGIRFIDYYNAPRAVRRIINNQDVAAFAGVALGAAFQSIGDLFINREIDRRLQNDLSPQIQGILSSGRGVLIVTVLQEWDKPDFNDMRARTLLEVYVHGGLTQDSARQDWENTSMYLKGPPEGWHTVTRYGWIPPLD